MRKKLKAFTLIELLVAMTIVFSLMLLTYAPYSHYQKKAKLKLSSREIAQSFYEAKNMAVSWLKDEDSNRSIWLYFDTSPWKNNSITFFSYPHDIEERNIKNTETWEIKKIREKRIQPWIEINDLWWKDNLRWKDNLLFFYESITWKTTVYSFNRITEGKDILDEEEEISIKFSFKNSSSPVLTREITYFTKTNIVDYK